MVCLLVFQASILWRVGEADTDMVSLPLAEPGPAADSRFYLMWTSSVGFQSWFQHMISIMSRGGTHACWWMTGDSGQTGEGVGRVVGGLEEEMEDGQQMESAVEGERHVEVERQMDQVDEVRGEDEMEEWIR